VLTLVLVLVLVLVLEHTAFSPITYAAVSTNRHRYPHYSGGRNHGNESQPSNNKHTLHSNCDRIDKPNIRDIKLIE
jgi:hypothetical protein